jgi:membrane protease YdiL (CAAX protease family)
VNAAAAILLVVALAGLALFLKRDLEAYRRFKALTDTRARQRQLRAWIAITFVLFVGYTVLTLIVLGRIGDLARMPPAFAPVANMLAIGDISSGDVGGLVGGMAIGVAIVLVGGMALGLGRRRRAQPKTLGDVEALLPRNPAELAHTAALSVNAGIGEELFFRLALPLLIVLVTGDAWLAFALAAIVFGLAHLYQGAVGVIATTLLGVLLTAVYLASGSIWLAVLLHMVIDLVGLVLRPLLSGTVRFAEPTA